MHFRILGSLDVSLGQISLQFPNGRQRTVLAMLLMQEGSLVSLDRITEGIWGEDPPVTAKGQIHTCISALRRELRKFGDDHAIATSLMGYTIHLPAGSLDSTAFRRMVSSGRELAAAGKIRDAAAELRAALALWRGPAVAADVESAVVRTMAIRLEEEQIRTTEECIELEFELDRHHELVAELSELVRAHPLRESLRALHMVALHRSDRQADALESFQEIRDTLREELGLEPSDRLHRLHKSFLRRVDPLSVTPRTASGPKTTGNFHAIVPRQLPPTVADFTGREEVVDAIVAKLSGSGSAEGRRYMPVVCLNGNGGVGKTTLALHVAHAVHHLYDEGAIFVQLPGGDGHRSDPLDVLAKLLGSLGFHPAALPEDLEHRKAVYRSWLGDRKVLLLLDDADSAAIVTTLMPGNANCCVIVTSRYPLTSLPGAVHVHVENLDEAACVELLGKMVRPERVAAESDMALELVRLCECLPLAVRIVAAKLVKWPHWSIRQMVSRLKDETRRLDELTLGDMSVRATIASSCSGLSRGARQLFTRLGLLGPVDFASWVCAPLLDADGDSAADLLDELAAARLVEVKADDTGRYRFRLHALVRIFSLERLAVDEVPSERRAALSRLSHCWLSLAVDAHRRVHGSDGPRCAARSWTLPAGVRDQLLVDPLGWLRLESAALVLAVSQAAHLGLDEVCWGLAVALVALFESDHRVEDWLYTHETALDAVRRTGNERGEAALLYSLGMMTLNGGVKDATSTLESALRLYEGLGDVPGRARALGALAFADRMAGRFDRALLGYRRALADHRSAGDQVGEVDVLGDMAQIHMDRGLWDDARLFLDQAVAKSTTQAPRTAARVEHRLGTFHLRTGNWRDAEESFVRVLARARECGDTVGEAHASAALGSLMTRRGHHESAQAALSAALTLSRGTAGGLDSARVLLSFVEFCVVVGDWDRAASLIGEALTTFGETGPAPVLRARFLEFKAHVETGLGHPRAAEAARGEAFDITQRYGSGIAPDLQGGYRLCSGASWDWL
ncbi:BTAD domain-containing putative transcriptional regulator [Lentzea chajnantorensis]